MKRLLLFCLLLNFVLANAQVNLVKWDGTTNLTPTIQNDYVTADNFTGSGISGPTASYDGINGTNWPTGNSIDTSKYFQITVSQVLDGQFTLNNINMGYKGNCGSYEVRYSKSADFSNPVTVFTTNSANIYGSDIDAFITGLNIVVNGGEKLYIRFYAFNGGGNWKMRNFLNLQGTINAVPNPLQGNYVVGNAPGSSFPTLTTAMNALNLVGVSAPTTFLLDDALYHRNSNEKFPIVINPYNGNTSHSVTIKPNAGKTVTIEATNFPEQTNTPAVFKLNGVDNFIIDGSNNNSDSKNLTLFNNNPLNQEKTVVWIASQNNSNGANNNTVKNTVLQQATRNDEVSFGVFAAGTGSGTSLGKNNAADASNNNNTISNNTFSKVGQAVYVNGNSGNPSSGWKIQNNTIGGTNDSNKPFWGVYLNNAPSYEISGNTISGLLKNTTSISPSAHSGIIISGSSSGKIFSNIIRDVYDNTYNDYCAGIYINNASNNTIYNNMISNIRTNSPDNGNYNIHLKGHGIYLNGGSGNKLYFNTVFMSGSGSSNKRSSALFIAAGTNIELKNNIFYNEQTQGTQYAIYSYVASSQITSDYNDFVAEYVGNVDGNNRQTLADWQNHTSKDANSISVTPNFVSATDLHLDNTNQSNLDNLDNKGNPIAAFILDFDGDVRDVTNPDLGADEFAEEITTVWNGNSWSNGTPSDDANVVINAAYDTALNGTFTAKSVTVTTTGTLDIKAGTALTITDQLTNENPSADSVIVESGANLIQSGNSNLNSGIIKVKRSATMRRLDYVYWSSPVAGQNLKAFSPQTVSPPTGSSRFYEMIESTNQFSALDPMVNDFVPAKGFMIRAPNNFPSNGNPATFNGIFTGVPNNGDYSINVTKDGFGFNMIGNPYPSTINADSFLDQNPTLTTLYFWTHGQAGATNDSANYATYNATGQTAAAATLPANAPNGTIQIGQGFLASTTAAATVNFTNSMREANFDNQFFRGVASTQKNRFWLNLSNGSGNLNQMLVGYLQNATDGLDTHYDAKLLELSGSKLYSVISGDAYVIQGKALPFHSEDQVSVGFKAETAGNYIISLSHKDGLFAGEQTIFLKDNQTGLVHDIVQGPYVFASEAGTFNERFTILYQNVTLGVENPESKNNIVVYPAGNGLQFDSGSANMKSVAVFDVRGRLLFEAGNQKSNSIHVPLSAQKQVLLVKTILDNDSEITKKVIF